MYDRLLMFCSLKVLFRYNPAAERVRQRSQWIQQLEAEERSKPLELDSESFAQIMRMVWISLIVFLLALS